jgi:hypothetical protein
MTDKLISEIDAGDAVALTTTSKLPFDTGTADGSVTPQEITDTGATATASANRVPKADSNGSLHSWVKFHGATENTDAPQGADEVLVWDNSASAYKRQAVDTFAKRLQTIVLGAGGWPSTTSGSAAVTKSETTTNKQNIQTFDFDKDTDEYAEWTVILPDNYDGGTVKATPIWTASAGTATETVQWMVQGRAYANDDAIDAAWGTAVGVSDALIATGDVHVAAETAAITLAGTPAGGQLAQFRVYRDVSEDTLAADAKLIAVKLKYGVNAWSA